jgi:hypothetical protein
MVLNSYTSFCVNTTKVQSVEKFEATTIELNWTNLQSPLNGKAPKIHTHASSKNYLFCNNCNK